MRHPKSDPIIGFRLGVDLKDETLRHPHQSHHILDAILSEDCMEPTVWPEGENGVPLYVSDSSMA